MKNTLRFVVMSLVGFASFASAEEPVNFEQIKVVYAEIHVLATSDLSCKKITDCLQIPVGERRCGGPSYYEVTSMNNPKIPEINRLNAESDKLIQQYYKENPGAGLCNMVVPPPLECLQQQCSQF